LADQKIGKATHYYDKIAVAVVKLTKGDLKLGDTVILTDKDGNEFNQKVESMQIKRADIEIAKSGDEFGLKVDKETKDNSDVIKTS
jgi:translation initiation factor IF-2